MIVLDTHVMVWFAEGKSTLGRRTTRLTDSALRLDELLVATISFWEVAMLCEKRRLELAMSPTAFRQKVLEQGVQEIPLDGAIAIAAAEIKRFHGDPADRMIVATALSAEATLVTADEAILEWRGELLRHDARR